MVFYSCDWCVLILDVIELFPLQSAVVRLSCSQCFLIVGIQCFRNFYFTVLVDVVGVKCYVNSLFDTASVLVRITINKLNLILKRLVSGVLGVL